MFGSGGEQTRMRSAAASSMLRQHESFRLKLTERGFELTSDDVAEPVICESWPRAKRVLQKLGVPERKMKEISLQLSEGKDIVFRMKV